MSYVQSYADMNKKKKDKSTSDSQPLGQSTREGYVFTDKQGNETIVKPFDESSASKSYDEQRQKLVEKYKGNNPNIEIWNHKKDGGFEVVYKNKKGKVVYVESVSMESKGHYVSRARAQHLSAVAKFKPKPIKTKTIARTVNKERPASGVISEKPYHGESLFPSSSASPTQKQFQTIHAAHTYISSAEATAIQKAQHAESRKEWLINAGKAAVLAPANIVTGLADAPGQIYFRLHKNEPATFYTYKANIAKSAPEMFALEAGEGFVASSVANVHAIDAELSPAAMEQKQLVVITKKIDTPQIKYVRGKSQTVTKVDIGFGHASLKTETDFVKGIPKTKNLINERAFTTDLYGEKGMLSNVAYSEDVNQVKSGIVKISQSRRIGSGISVDINDISDTPYSFVSSSQGVEINGKGLFEEAGKIKNPFGTTKYLRYTAIKDETVPEQFPNTFTTSQPSTAKIFSKSGGDQLISPPKSYSPSPVTAADANFPSSLSDINPGGVHSLLKTVRTAAEEVSTKKASVNSIENTMVKSSSLSQAVPSFDSVKVFSKAKNIALAKNTAIVKSINTGTKTLASVSLFNQGQLSQNTQTSVDYKPQVGSSLISISVPKQEIISVSSLAQKIRHSVKSEPLSKLMPSQLGSVKSSTELKNIQGLESGQRSGLIQLNGQLTELKKEIGLRTAQESSSSTFSSPSISVTFGNGSMSSLLQSPKKLKESNVSNMFKFGRKTKYKPSLTAELFNIHGKKPKHLTGIEIRPLVKSKKSKRKKKGRKK